MKKIALTYGFWMLLGFIALFLFMHLLGLSENYYLRVLNGGIHISLIYLAIRQFRSQQPQTSSNYVSGTAMGMYASMLGVVGFTIFMFLYLTFNVGFMETLKTNMPIAEYLNPFTASLFIFVEGVVISLIGSYIVTRVIDMEPLKMENLKDGIGDWR